MTISGRFAAATGSAPLVELWPSGLTRHRTASELVHDELSPRWLTRTGVVTVGPCRRRATRACRRTPRGKPPTRDPPRATRRRPPLRPPPRATPPPRPSRGSVSSRASRRGVRSLGEPRDRRPVGLRARRQRDDDRSAHRVGAFAEAKAERDLPARTRARRSPRSERSRVATSSRRSPRPSPPERLGIDSASALRRFSAAPRAAPSPPPARTHADPSD